MSLIVLEGLDGSGKSTQFQLLQKALSARGRKVKTVKFPDYGSPSSSLVKMYLAGEFGADPADVNPYAVSTFYAADRFASFCRCWGEEYRRGAMILADRYTTSNYIYQMGKLGRESWESYLLWVEDLEYGKLRLPKPDRVIYLDMPVEISQRLLSRRYQGNEGKKDIHENHLEYLKRCAACARFAAERLSWDVVPCGRGDSPQPVEEIHREVLRLALGTADGKEGTL